MATTTATVYTMYSVHLIYVKRIPWATAHCRLRAEWEAEHSEGCMWSVRERRSHRLLRSSRACLPRVIAQRPMSARIDWEPTEWRNTKVWTCWKVPRCPRWPLAPTMSMWEGSGVSLQNTKHSPALPVHSNANLFFIVNECGYTIVLSTYLQPLCLAWLWPFHLHKLSFWGSL